MTVERLSALDASFLAVESPAAPMHVGWVSTYDLPEDGSRPRFAELFEHLAGRFAHAPRCRRKLAPVPLGITSPRGPTTPTSTPPSTSCTRAAPTSTRSSTRSSPSRSRATARCGRSGSPTSSRTASS